jgi:dTDP-4-dehydrorhamnose 3,5-epimerase
MRFEEIVLRGVWRVSLERLEDARGYFARTWCDREAAAHGLRTPMVQDSVAYNRKAGTLRGLHYHATGFDQARLIRCDAGAVFLAILDLRADAPTYLATFETTIDARTRHAFYVPPGLAVGYQTLADDTVIAYKMPEFYEPSQERGLRWDDRCVTIAWPNRQPILSEKDAAWPDYNGPGLDVDRQSRR